MLSPRNQAEIDEKINQIYDAIQAVTGFVIPRANISANKEFSDKDVKSLEILITHITNSFERDFDRIMLEKKNIFLAQFQKVKVVRSVFGKDKIDDETMLYAALDAMFKERNMMELKTFARVCNIMCGDDLQVKPLLKQISTNGLPNVDFIIQRVFDIIG